MKIALCVPWSSPFMFTGFFDGNMNMQCPQGCEKRWFRGEGWSPARRHVDACERALAWDADYICILGADQQHPEDLLVRLVERIKEGCEVVSAMVPTRGHILNDNMRAYQPLAWKFDGSLIDPNDGNVQEVYGIGSGVLMFHRDHLESLKKPWFYDEIDDRERWERKGTMDSTFVRRLQFEAHARIWVDTTIKVKHLNVDAIDETWQENHEQPRTQNTNGTDRGNGTEAGDEHRTQPGRRLGAAYEPCCQSRGCGELDAI